jgi:hypothetical protein
MVDGRLDSLAPENGDESHDETDAGKVTDLLYKVSAPSHTDLFEPRSFWRSEDWAFSDDHPHDGLIEDHVLYAGEFDEVNIHLLPHVWRLRVRLDDEERRARLRACGFDFDTASRALIFVGEEHRSTVESFEPTVFAFDRAGFERTPTNEFVSREPRRAVSKEMIPIAEAIARWQVEITYVSDTAALEARLRDAGIDHQIQA